MYVRTYVCLMYIDIFLCTINMYIYIYTLYILGGAANISTYLCGTATN